MFIANYPVAFHATPTKHIVVSHNFPEIVPEFFQTVSLKPSIELVFIFRIQANVFNLFPGDTIDIEMTLWESFGYPIHMVPYDMSLACIIAFCSVDIIISYTDDPYFTATEPVERINELRENLIQMFMPYLSL